ncbi:hypothetical protein LGR54_25280 [Ancylobacter sp. Lp-2]|uniref:hypothetical protein n=1 Tax=Ancylobacter sp. Lp-2 TaxID=2881339 RepID=UPI001E324CA6|nr:hypothetical protein [Ancylobacter sp. Lp-2]MCB4771926.1 hypothetical protein [Ancylobacter sp. Lp-2]
MPSPFLRFDPDTVQLLDRCMTQAQQVAAAMEAGPIGPDMRNRLASALIEALRHGEQDETNLVEFALRVLPAYRERRAGT